MHWLAAWDEIRRLMGWDSGTSFGYLFHSGSGATLELGAWGTALWWWRTSCQHSLACLRHATHDWTDPGTGVIHRLCWRHHPDLARKYAGARLRELRQAGHLYLGDRPGRG